MALSRDQILKHAGTPDVGEVHVPKWSDGGDDLVKVRGITLREWELHQARVAREDGKGLANAALISRCVVDDNGGRVFRDGDVDQIAELGVGEMTKLVERILELSGLTDASEEAVRGESDSAPSSSSSSE